MLFKESNVRLHHDLSKKILGTDAAGSVMRKKLATKTFVCDYDSTYFCKTFSSGWMLCILLPVTTL